PIASLASRRLKDSRVGPSRLRKYLRGLCRTSSTSGQKAPGSLLKQRHSFTIADRLRTGVVPADLRAALYKTAALIPDVTAGDRQATVDCRAGIAIGIPTPDGGTRRDIIIDPTSPPCPWRPLIFATVSPM